MFKGPDQDIEAVLTAPVSAVCGVTLDAGGKKEYLISGTCWQDQTRFFRKTNASGEAPSCLCNGTIVKMVVGERLEDKLPSAACQGSSVCQ